MVEVSWASAIGGLGSHMLSGTDWQLPHGRGSDQSSECKASIRTGRRPQWRTVKLIVVSMAKAGLRNAPAMWMTCVPGEKGTRTR